MSTELRNVPDCNAQYELTQTRFWGGKNRLQCVQVTDRKGNYLQLTKHQARQLAVELLLFAEGVEVEKDLEWTGQEEEV
jgi:hypothetical protein